MKGSVDSMFMYVSLALVAITAFFVLFNLIKGLIRGFKKTIGSLIAVALSAIIAFVATAFICDPGSELVAQAINAVKDAIAESDAGAVFELESLGEAITHYAAMIAAPFVFMAIYAVVSIIVSIIVGIIIRVVSHGRKGRGPLHRLGGLILGAVCGLLVSLLMLMPVVGVLNIVITVGESEVIPTEELSFEDFDFEELLDEASEDEIYAIYSASCGWLFDSLASTTFYGEKVYLKDEIVVMLSIIEKLGTLSGDASQFTEDQIDAIDSAFDEVEKSPIISNTVADIVSTMAENWQSGETFLGAEKLDAGELLNPLIDTVLNVLANTKKAYVIEDMKTLTGVLRVLVKHDMISNSEDYEQMLEILGKDGVIAELIEVANGNERMSVISDEITQLSMRALASTIGIPSGADERYDLLMDNIAEILNDSDGMSDDERLEYVENEVVDALDRYGVEVGEQATKDIAVSIIQDLGERSDLEGKDVSEFFIMYAIASANSNSDGASLGVEYLASKKASLKLVVNGDGTVSVNGVVLENYDADNYGDSAAYKMGLNRVNLDGAATLYSAASMESTLITLDDLLTNVKKYSDCKDPDAEAQKVSDILAYAMDVFGSDIGDMERSEMLSKVGELLDMMHKTEIFGEKTTGDLLKAIFQKDDVRGNLGLTNAEINTFTDKLNDTANSENGSYISTTQAVSNTVQVVDKIQDSNTSREERREATESLISDMTPENAELLGTMTSPNMMIQYGASEEKAGIVADSVTVLFNNMANYTSDTTAESGDEEYAKEADAVNTMLTLAMNSAESKSESLFATGEDEGKTGMGAEEYVDFLAGSEVVSKTLITTVYEDGNTENPFGVVPTEEDKVVLTDALNAYYEQNVGQGDDEELQKKLNAIAIISNIDLVFGENA